jgi:DNA-binding SARP family transcriptional activator
MPAGIIIPADAARLLPGEVAAGIPGVSVPASLEAALDEMEAVLLSQARTSGAFDASDGPQATVSAAGTTGPGAALIATCGPGTTQRLRGILESGRALGAAAILLGPWQLGVTCQVAADGMVTDVMPSGAGLEGIRLFNLGAAEAAAITAVLRDARGTPPAAPALARPATATVSPPSRRAADVPREPRPAAGSYLPAPAMPAPPAPARAAQHHAGTSTPRCGHSRCGHPALAGAAPAADGEAATPDTARPVQLTMLGPLRITAAGQEIGGGLRKARELMTFLAVHPDGASAEAISEALWPQSDTSHATGQRNLALRKAWGMLRSSTGLAAPMWITHASGRYRLDPSLIRADLWQFSDALDKVRHAAGDEARLAACRKAAGLYHGELAEGEGYDWAEPYAETARRRALDAWTTIADILQARDPDQALAALESALSHDPYNEFLYQCCPALKIPMKAALGLPMWGCGSATCAASPATSRPRARRSRRGCSTRPPSPRPRRSARGSAAPRRCCGCAACAWSAAGPSSCRRPTSRFRCPAASTPGTSPAPATAACTRSWPTVTWPSRGPPRRSPRRR